MRLLKCPMDVGRRVASLSVAQRRIVEIARAVAHDARLIVPDEPSAVLGEAEIGQLSELMRRLRRQRRVAFIYVSRLEAPDGGADSVTSRAGLRSCGTAHGRFLLGRPFFLRSVLEQGYWPQSRLAERSSALERRDVP